MGDGGDIEAQKLFVTRGAKEKRVILYDAPCLGWGSIGENEGDGEGLRLEWQLVALRELGINKTTLATAVYHCSGCLPFPCVYRLDVDVDVC